MATATVALVLVLWPLFGLGDVTSAAIGCFFGMSIFIGFTPMGRDMTEDLQTWHKARAEIGRRGLRESRRAVKDGRAVDDPAFAHCAIRLAERNRLALARPASWWWLALTAGLVVLSAVRGNIVGAIIFGLALVTMPLLRRLTRGRLERIERSIAANQRLLDHP
jgi:hypothetical protein